MSVASLSFVICAITRIIDVLNYCACSCVNQMLISQLDPLTEQQVMGIYSLQQSTQQAEEALSQGLEQLQQSLIETIAGGPVVDGMQQMVVALGKLENLEGFVRQVIKTLFNTLNQMPIIDNLTYRE